MICIYYIQTIEPVFSLFLVLHVLAVQHSSVKFVRIVNQFKIFLRLVW